MYSRDVPQTGGIQRNEMLAAAVEVLAIVTIFIIAFTGRSHFGDGVRQLMIGLSLAAGAFGVVAGVWVLARGFLIQPGRLLRFVLGGFMAALGIYTIVHVL